MGCVGGAFQAERTMCKDPEAGKIKTPSEGRKEGSGSSVLKMEGQHRESRS